MLGRASVVSICQGRASLVSSIIPGEPIIQGSRSTVVRISLPKAIGLWGSKSRCYHSAAHSVGLAWQVMRRLAASPTVLEHGIRIKWADVALSPREAVAFLFKVNEKSVQCCPKDARSHRVKRWDHWRGEVVAVLNDNVVCAVLSTLLHETKAKLTGWNADWPAHWHTWPSGAPTIFISDASAQAARTAPAARTPTRPPGPDAPGLDAPGDDAPAGEVLLEYDTDEEDSLFGDALGDAEGMEVEGAEEAVEAEESEGASGVGQAAEASLNDSSRPATPLAQSPPCFLTHEDADTMGAILDAFIDGEPPGHSSAEEGSGGDDVEAALRAELAQRTQAHAEEKREWGQERAKLLERIEALEGRVSELEGRDVLDSGLLNSMCRALLEEVTAAVRRRALVHAALCRGGARVDHQGAAQGRHAPRARLALLTRGGRRGADGAPRAEGQARRAHDGGARTLRRAPSDEGATRILAVDAARAATQPEVGGGVRAAVDTHSACSCSRSTRHLSPGGRLGVSLSGTTG